MHDRICGFKEFVSITLYVNYSIMKHKNFLTNPACSAHIVGDGHRSDFQLPAYLLDQLVDTVCNNRVQSSCRFIIKNDFRFIHQSTS